MKYNIINIPAKHISVIWIYLLLLFFFIFNAIITEESESVIIFNTTNFSEAKSLGTKIDALNDNNSARKSTNTLNKHEPKMFPNPASKFPFLQSAIVETTSGRDVAIAKNNTPAVDADKLNILAKSSVT